MWILCVFDSCVQGLREHEVDAYGPAPHARHHAADFGPRRQRCSADFHRRFDARDACGHVCV